MSESALQKFQLLKDHEEKLVVAFSNTDLLHLSRKLLENVVITKEVDEKFATLDHDRIESMTRSRYLFCHILERIKSNRASYSSLIKALKADGNVRQVVQMIDEQLTNGISNKGLEASIAMEVDVQLGERDLPSLTEFLAKCAHKWEEIGIGIGLSIHVLEECRKGKSDNICLHRILTKWITGAYPNAISTTLNKLQKVLAGNLVQEGKLAQELEAEFNKPGHQSLACLPRQDSGVPFRVVYQSCSIEILDHKSALLEVQVLSNDPVSYQWMKDGKPLSDSSDYSGTHTDILYISKATLGFEGDYCCQVTHSTEYLTSSPATVTIIYPPDKRCSLDLYSTWSEIPETPYPFANADFIVPTLIKIKNQRARDHSLFLQGKMNRILESMEKVEYLTIFHEYKPRALVLVEGRPGSGKTTLAHRLVKDWAKGEVLKNADNVFHISLRKPFIDLFEKFNDRQSEILSTKLKQSNGEGICFVLDGYDEYISTRKTDSVIDQLIQKSYLPLAMVIVTSRPVATVEIRHRTSTILEILGFTKEQFESYVSSYPFEKLSEYSIQEFLKAFSDVVNICYLPINASIICFLYSQQLNELPKTETQIYEKFVEAIILRELRLRNASAQSVKDLTKAENQCFSQICLLAFTMTSVNTQIRQNLPPSLTPLNESLFCGLLTSDHVKYGMEKVFTFLHLTLQEYLAARHLASLDEDKQTYMIRLHSGKPHMLTMFKFYCGLVSFKNKMYQFDLITKSVGPDCLYRVHCAYESQQKDVCRNALRFMNYKVFLSYGTFTPADFIALGHVISIGADSVLDFEMLPGILYEDSVGELWKNRELDLKDSSVRINAAGIYADIASCMDDRVFSRVSFSLRPQFLYSQYKMTNFYAQLWRNIFNSRINECWQHMSWPHSVNNNFAADIMSPLASALKSCRKLLRFKISKYSDKDARIVADILKFNKKTLQTLVISNSDYTAYSVSTLFKELKSCKTIHKLDLSFCKFSVESVAALATGIIQCTNLKVLNLNNCNLGPYDMQTLCKGLKKLSLSKLNMSSNNIGQDGAIALAKTCIKTITHLNLSLNVISLTGIYVLANEIERQPNLINLALSSSNISLSAMRALVQGLSRCRDLKFLWIPCNAIGSDCMATLSNGLSTNISLETLCLGSNSLCSQDMAILSGGLKNWKKIKCLVLSSNNISSEGIPALVHGLKLLDNLKELDLSINQIDSRGARDLAQGIKYIPMLETLNLSNNKIGSNGVAAVIKSLPCNKIKYLFFSHNDIGPGNQVSIAVLIERTQLILLDLSNNKIGSQGVGQLISVQKKSAHPPMLNLSANDAQEVVEEISTASQMEWKILL